MKAMIFAGRNRKEILRDPINLAFGIGFPLILLLLLSAIQANIPADLFRVGKLAPGVSVFGLSFLSLFSATLISKDRLSLYLMRLFASPLTANDFILGYTIPFLPMAAAQSAVCYLISFALGLPVNANALFAIAVNIPASFLYIAIGLLAGSLLTDKQAGGICGALLTNVSAWLSGIWFDLSLVGGAFEKIANLLPFVHAVDAAKASVAGNYADILPNLMWVIGYTIPVMLLAVSAFKRQMRSDR